LLSRLYPCAGKDDQYGAEMKRAEKLTAVQEESEAAASGAVPMNEDSPHEDGADAEAAADQPDKGLADLMDKGATRYHLCLT